MDGPARPLNFQTTWLRRLRNDVALPAWGLSLAVHLLCLASLATLTHAVVSSTQDEPPRQVGIVTKTDSPSGTTFENDRKKFADKPTPADPLESLEQRPPTKPADSAGEVPPVDLPIGVAGKAGGASELLPVPGPAGLSGPGVAATRFFGPEAVQGSRFVYVIDRSGSMSHRSALEVAKRELLASIAPLPPEAQFQVVLYNDRVTVMSLGGAGSKLLPATEANKLLARKYLQSVQPDGGTQHVPPLKAAIHLEPDVIFFLTDADMMTMAQVREITAANRSRATIHTVQFDVGPDLNEDTPLRNLSRLNGGSYRYVDVNALAR